MPNLSYLDHRRRLRNSLSVLAACFFALPAAAFAEAPERESVARRTGDDLTETPGQLVSPMKAEDVSGAPGEAIPLALTVGTNPGRSVSNAYLLGLPKGARLADADHAVTAADEKAVIDITNWDLPQLSVTPPPAQAGTYTLAVVAVSRSDNDEPMNLTRSTFTLNATAESRKPASASQPKRPDEAVMREAPLLRPRPRLRRATKRRRSAPSRPRSRPLPPRHLPRKLQQISGASRLRAQPPRCLLLPRHAQRPFTPPRTVPRRTMLHCPPRPQHAPHYPSSHVPPCHLAPRHLLLRHLPPSHLPPQRPHQALRSRTPKPSSRGQNA